MTDVFNGDGDPLDVPASIGERAAGGENEREAEPPEPPMEGPVQLSLNVGGLVGDRNARKVTEATIKLVGGERAVSGLFDVDTEYDLLVRVLPDGPKSVPVRDPNTRKTRSWKQRQDATVLSVRRADGPDAIRDLFADLLGRDEGAARELMGELAEFLQPVGQAA